MVDITVNLTDVEADNVDYIVDSCEELGENVKINITEPWPKLEFGDRFVYATTDYAFIAYVSKYKIRAVAMDALVNHAVLQPIYFDCAKREAHMKFIIRK